VSLVVPLPISFEPVSRRAWTGRRHPNIKQLIGYSPPNSSKAFYVTRTGLCSSFEFDAMTLITYAVGTKIIQEAGDGLPFEDQLRFAVNAVRLSPYCT
jgi:hypothetical protein